MIIYIILMSEENNKKEKEINISNTMSYDIYIIDKDRQLYKKTNEEYKKINEDDMEGFKNFSSDKEICDFLKNICDDLGYKTENMIGGSNYEFNNNKKIQITDNSNPIAILKILKCLGFKTYKINEIKYIQSCEQWNKLYSNDIEKTSEENKDKKKNLLNFLRECVELVNKNLGLLNDFSGLLELNNNKSIGISEELLQIKNELHDEICDKLKEILDDKDKVKLINIKINELGTGAESIISFIKMMRNNKASSGIIQVQTGGFYKNNLFNNKCGDRITNVLDKLSNAVDKKHVLELKKNITDLSKNTKSLNTKINEIVGGGSCKDIDYKNLGDEIQKHVDKTTAMSFALFELLKISKDNGIDIDENPESIQIFTKTTRVV